MALRNDRGVSCLSAITGALILLLLIFCTGGCLSPEPEELPPESPTAIPVTILAPAPADTITVTTVVPGQDNSSRVSPPIAITSPQKAILYTERDFPQEVMDAVGDFTGGRTSDTINGFLRWDSVRARTAEPDAARIREQIRRIDYAMSNTTLQENLRLYLWVSGEQAKRIQNESAFSDSGYLVASYDPTVIYHRLWNTGRDRDGYLTMCVLDFRKGDHLLFVNATEREFLIPRGKSWEVTGIDTYEQLSYTADSITRYDEIAQTNIRLVSMKEHL